MRAYTVTACVPGYLLVTNLNTGAAGIYCENCMRVSYHPQDIEQRYCGHCHRWHEIER
jgi:uncharacterized OB-fold protein